MLEQQKENTGAATGLIACFSLLFGSLGMVLINLDSTNQVFTLGALTAIVGFVSLIGWILIGRQKFIKEMPEITTKAN